jgi:hypothetical protein
VAGWLAGYAQALTYQETRGIAVNNGHHRVLDILLVAHLVTAALLTVGFLWLLVTGKKGTR